MHMELYLLQPTRSTLTAYRGAPALTLGIPVLKYAATENRVWLLDLQQWEATLCCFLSSFWVPQQDAPVFFSGHVKWENKQTNKPKNIND